ncbi:MAG: peptidyl-prolyl cis-trans isomerase B (cyclophilin B) [Planctomycetota bacterium]|jgi:peptidyl-prolyl cis-trans isomerase B (cyclophilin B)
MLMKIFAPILLAALLVSCGSKTTEKPKELGPQSNLKGVAAVDHFIAYVSQNGFLDKTDTNWKIKATRPDIVEFDPSKKIYWMLETSKGLIKIELLPEVAPMHVTSTIYLTRIGFYDNLTFHRILPGFVMQGGCPLGTGKGGPGYQMRGEMTPKAKHDARGTLSAANSGPNSDGSQFFITYRATPGLDGKHTVYGRVIEGEHAMIKVERQGSPEGNVKRPIFITKATIIEQ